MKKPRIDGLVTYVRSRWQNILSMTLLCLLIMVVLTYRLKTFTSGASIQELSYISTNSSFKDILEQPTFLHHRLLGFISHSLGHHGIVAMRLISVVTAAFALLLFYLIIKKWHTKRIALFTLALFSSSSTLLVHSRNAGPGILFILAPLLVLSSVFWIIGKKNDKHPVLFLLIGASALSMLFVPYIFYFSTVLFFIYRKSIFAAVKNLPTKMQIATLLCWFLVLSIFIITLGIKTDAAKIILGIPTGSISLENIWESGSQLVRGLFVASKENAELNLGTLPTLDVIASAMIFLGAYFYLILHKKLNRTYALFIGGIVLSLAITPSGYFASQVLLLPLAYIGVAAGLTVFLGQWFTVFPRNPLARSVGVFVVTLLVSLTSIYHLSRYFIAFRYAPETKAIYSNSDSNYRKQ